LQAEISKSPRSIEQLEIQKEACGGKTTIKAVLTLCTKGEMD
jgi:hypothetical protein